MKLSFRVAAIAAAVSAVVDAAQIPFSLKNSPEGSASLFKHPSLPAHSLRVVSPPPSLCDSTVKSYSGYLDVDVDKLEHHDDSAHPSSIFDATKHEKDGKTSGAIEHFYFWAFESRNDPATDPVVLWLNGGPGCSSFTGLLMELGPCNAANPQFRGDHPGTERNPWSWNNNATMIFLDQPVGVGYSYVDWANKSRTDKPPRRVFSAESAARDASAFLHLLSMHAGKEIFKGERQFPSFHIAGESYAGRYIPLTANQILEDNKMIEKHPESGLKPLPLTSVLIGNGITSPKDQFPAYVEYTCTTKSGAEKPLLPKKTCKLMKESIPTCLTLVEKCNRRNKHGKLYDVPACKAASEYCEDALSSPYNSINRSVYDWQHGPKYEQEDWVAAFLNDPATKTALGVDGKGPGDKHDGVFVGCSDDVYADFAKTGDGAKESTWAVRSIVDQGVRVLSYSGRRDYICNFLGNHQWTDNLDWEFKDEFQREPLLPWFLGEQNQIKGGEFKNFGQLTYAIVDEAGHFVPLDQPQAALAMFNKWLHNPGNGKF